MNLNSLTYEDVASRKPPTLAEMRNYMKKVVAHCEVKSRSYHESDNRNNPQIVEMRKKAEAEYELAKAVLDAMQGDMVNLRFYME